jgi:hypothetical protein
MHPLSSFVAINHPLNPCGGVLPIPGGCTLHIADVLADLAGLAGRMPAPFSTAKDFCRNLQKKREKRLARLRIYIEAVHYGPRRTGRQI